MDPASAVVGIISFGFTVIKEINDLRKAIKNAPEQVQALHDSSVAVSLLLSRLQLFGARAFPHTPQATDYFNSLCDKVNHSLKEVSTIMEKIVQPHRPEDDSGHRKPKIALKRWIASRDRLDRIAGKLTELRKALCEMLEFSQADHIDLIVNCVDNIQIIQNNHSCQLTNISARIDDMQHGLDSHFNQLSNIAKRIEDIRRCPTLPTSPRCSTHVDDALTFSSINPARSRLHNSLKCPPKCECRCHHPSMVKLVSGRLAYYIGQVSISKRFLHPTFSPWSLCNVSTCRGDLHRAITLQWDSPLRLLNGLLQYSKDRRIHFSLGAPRVVPYNSPLFKAVWSGNYHTIRDLFATGQAFIWDYDIHGLPVFSHVCRYWQQNNNTAALEILRLFVEAGADALLFEEVADGIDCAHDTLVLGCITYLSDNMDKQNPIANILRTNPSAINVFRSLLDIDPLDALEDFLSRKRTQNVDIVSFLASLEDAECDSTNLVSMCEVIGYSPLEYAVIFAPQQAMALLQNGESAAGDGTGTLFNAILLKFLHLIEPLLDAGADVNIRDWKGHTPLHWACSWCRYDEFFELIRWAESDIDWRARTRDGRNALDLFDSGVLEGFGVNHSQVELDEFRTVLVDHLAFDDDDDELDRSGEFRLDVPGAFPDVSC